MTGTSYNAVIMQFSNGRPGSLKCKLALLELPPETTGFNDSFLEYILYGRTADYNSIKMPDFSAIKDSPCKTTIAPLPYCEGRVLGRTPTTYLLETSDAVMFSDGRLYLAAGMIRHAASGQISKINYDNPIRMQDYIHGLATEIVARAGRVFEEQKEQMAGYEN
jgi:hypothetical protein